MKKIQLPLLRANIGEKRDKNDPHYGLNTDSEAS